MQLKENIREEIKALTLKSFTTVMKHAIERARICEGSFKGKHLNDVIFHS